MTLQVEFIRGDVTSMEGVEEFENLINKFSSEHNVIDIETNLLAGSKTIIGTAVIKYEMDDKIKNGWKGLYNEITKYTFEDVLKAFFMAENIYLTEDTADELVRAYANKNTSFDLCEISGIEYKVDMEE